MADKTLDIYNDRMELIGQKPRSEVHGNGYWHKAFHCWVIYKDKAGKAYVILQKRSATKDVVPNSLDITAAGHLEAGEKPEDGLRELKEELGIQVDKNKLTPLGIHVEVYSDAKVINREFDHVYFLEINKDLKDFKVQPEEVVALTKISLDDGIKLFSKQVRSIPAVTVNFNASGLPSGNEEKHSVSIPEFAGGERNNYFIKVFLLAKRYFEGEKLLYI